MRCVRLRPGADFSIAAALSHRRIAFKGAGHLAWAKTIQKLCPVLHIVTKSIFQAFQIIKKSLLVVLEKIRALYFNAFLNRPLFNRFSHSISTNIAST